ncbi:hypothetical protein [Salinimonas chungwhensis]|uniref:hypothetical protein n=1 Tax=Salinimonas chungwhensis TaxID=265425 RepID=UPI000373E1D2|nr:hypothetical protein [Salinimonas chungwhensis]
MSEWIGAIGFGIGLLAFVLGMTSIIMGFMGGGAGAKGMQHKIEYGFFGISGLVVSLLMGYALA